MFPRLPAPTPWFTPDKGELLASFAGGLGEDFRVETSEAGGGFYTREACLSVLPKTERSAGREGKWQNPALEERTGGYARDGGFEIGVDGLPDLQLGCHRWPA